MKKLYSSIIFILLSLCFVVGSCFSPLDHYNGRDNGDGSISVILPSIQFVSGTSGSRVSAFSGDPYTMDDLDYTVTFTNTATNKVVEAEVTKSDNSVSARALITPGRWKIDVEAKFSAIARVPGVPGETYALAYETIDIQKNETIDIQMKRVIKVVFISGGETVDTQFVIEDGKITRPQNPTHDGYIYTFEGWYTKDGTTSTVWGDKWIFTNNVPSHISHYELYAKWVEEFQDGSAAAPFLVYSPETLAKVGSGTDNWDMDKHYKMIADIDMDIAPYNIDPGWVPIGTQPPNNPFRGNFDGNGRIVKNLFINRPAGNQQGLFGATNGATIKNIGIENCNITAGADVGGLVGSTSNYSTITNCYATGNVTGSGNNVGGLIGVSANDSLVSNCYTTVTVIGTASYTGGLVGYNNTRCIITNCYATGNVNGASITGGLVGSNEQGSSITNSYATGRVSGSGTVGGLVGWQQMPLTPYTQNCVAANVSVTGTGVYTDRFLGWHAGGTLTNNYAFEGMTVNNALVSGGTLINATGADISVAQIKTQSTYTGMDWKFGNNDDNPWKMGNSSYPLPVLYWQTESSYQTLPAHLQGSGWFAGGEGTSASPYIIETADQLANLAKLVNAGNVNYTTAYYKLGNDIDLGPYLSAGQPGYNGGAGWMPIGTNTVGRRFMGVFDGNGKIIRNLYIYRNSSDYIGFFGFIDNATIKNIGVENCNITGRIAIGGITGHTWGGSVIENCFVTGVLLSTTYDSHIGGLVGHNHINDVIKNSYTTCNVTGTNNVGGLVGKTNYGANLIQNCYATGEIKGTYNVGGLIGLSISAVTIQNSVGANASVTSTNDTSARRLGAYSGTFQNNYAYEGMIVNNALVSGTLTNANGLDTSTAALKTQSFYTTASNWHNNIQTWKFGNNDDNPWKMGNSSYPLPVLYWQDTSTYPTLPAHLQGSGWFASGSGTESDPYIINTAAQLGDLAKLVNAGNTNYTSAHYKLGNDIDLGPYLSAGQPGYNGGAGWEPIGRGDYTSASNIFRGSFNGNYHKISGLYINNSALSKVGLFGGVFVGFLQNLIVEGNVIGNTDVGGIVGYGYGSGTIVTNCYSAVNVTGNSSVGGVIGFITNCRITNCYATGNISGNSNVGGVAGYLNNGGANYCYSTGKISGVSSVGGLVGTIANTSGFYLSSAVALNPSLERLSGTSTSFGRSVGYGSGSYVIGWEHMELPEGAAGQNAGSITTIEQTRTQATYSGTGQNWAFGTSDAAPWKMGNIDDGYPLPVFYWQDPSTYPELPEHLKE